MAGLGAVTEDVGRDGVLAPGVAVHVDVEARVVVLLDRELDDVVGVGHRAQALGPEDRDAGLGEVNLQRATVALCDANRVAPVLDGGGHGAVGVDDLDHVGEGLGVLLLRRVGDGLLLLDGEVGCTACDTGEHQNDGERRADERDADPQSVPLAARVEHQPCRHIHRCSDRQNGEPPDEVVVGDDIDADREDQADRHHGGHGDEPQGRV